MKTCEICGRPIKSGWKYCWEHRHTSQANTMREQREIDRATESFKDYKLKRLTRKLVIAVLVIALMIFIFGGFFGKIFLNVLGSIGFAGIIVLFAISEILRKRIEKMVENRDPEYVAFVQAWIRGIREEKNFRKSLLK